MPHPHAESSCSRRSTQTSRYSFMNCFRFRVMNFKFSGDFFDRFQMGFFSFFRSFLERRHFGAGNFTDADKADENSDSSGLFFELRTLQIATDFFSDMNKLGHGGFGPVYKGLMPNGQEIAVKKLSLESRQGVKEFINEVKLLLKVQHKNLVTLFGCCVEGPEKMLIYEYLPNKSLDYFLFDKEKSSSLDWRTRFRIVIGIVEGLVYLHEEAPLRIIHRDIKASNILLDKQMIPKISDFGLARLFQEDDTHVNTFRIAGTHGYMAPEYAMIGYLSVKSDVFSFGILVLEIVSGRQNSCKKLDAAKADLLSYTWSLYEEGNPLDLVDQTLETFNPEEAAMCIQLGLLCCQASVSDRPDMNRIQLMLSSKSFRLPRPGKPGLRGRQCRWSSSGSTTDPFKVSSNGSSVNEYSRNSLSESSIDGGR